MTLEERRNGRRRRADRGGLVERGALLVLVVLYLLGFQANADRDAQIRGEITQRRDQTCRLFEGDHKRDVDQLWRTYAYLDGLRPSQRRSALTRAIVQGLPELESKARMDTAPEFCDEPGAAAEARGAAPVGLPEPDPVVPPRRDYSRWLRR